LIYLDTSALVPIFLHDAHSARMLAWFGRTTELLTVSFWTIAEFSSAAAGQERMGQCTHDARVRAESAFDGWVAGVEQTPVLKADFDIARELLRRDQVRLRTPDALHLAVAWRLDFALASLDGQMTEAARQIGVRIEDL
jgi:predicted nucleic acid-binding protein